MSTIINVHLVQKIVTSVKIRTFLTSMMLITFFVVQVLALPTLENMKTELIVQVTIYALSIVFLIPVYIYITELSHRYQTGTLLTLQNQS